MTSYGDQYGLAHGDGRRIENKAQHSVNHKLMQILNPILTSVLGLIRTKLEQTKNVMFVEEEAIQQDIVETNTGLQSTLTETRVAGLDVVGHRTNIGTCSSSRPLGACIQVGLTPCHHTTSSPAKNVKLACGSELPIVSAACTMGSKMPVVEGLVGDQRVQVLRDTGCSTAVVRA